VPPALPGRQQKFDISGSRIRRSPRCRKLLAAPEGRSFALGGGAAAWPRAVLAQQPDGTRRIVASLNQPGSNATGVSLLTTERFAVQGEVGHHAPGNVRCGKSRPSVPFPAVGALTRSAPCLICAVKVAPPKQNPVGGIGSSGGVLTLGTRKGTKLPSPSQNHARTLPTSCRLDPRLWNLKCQATANANVFKPTRPTETGLPGWGGETRTRISGREPCI